MQHSLVFDHTFNILKKSLNITARRHSMISGNIANIDTIGYEPKDIDFYKVLERELNNQQDSLYCTHKKHFAHCCDFVLSGEVRKSKDDENNLDHVNIDTEMMKLLENSIKYRTSVEMLLRKISILRYVIQEGGR